MQLVEDIKKSPWTKGGVDSVKEFVGENLGRVTGEAKERLQQRVDERIMPHVDTLLDKYLPKVEKEAVKETAAAGSHLPTWAKVGLGTVGGLGLGLGAYKGYVGMNKEAALSNLLEQGYTVEHAVGLLKQAGLFR